MCFHKTVDFSLNMRKAILNTRVKAGSKKEAKLSVLESA